MLVGPRLGSIVDEFVELEWDEWPVGCPCLPDVEELVGPKLGCGPEGLVGNRKRLDVVEDLPPVVEVFAERLTAGILGVHLR